MSVSVLVSLNFKMLWHTFFPTKVYKIVLFSRVSPPIFALFPFWNSFHITPRPVCWTYAKVFWRGLACNKPKDLSKLRRGHLTSEVRSTREGIIIFKPTWLITVRASSVSKMFKIFPNNINNFINTFVHHIFVGTWRIMQPWNHLNDHPPEITIVGAK